MIFGFAGKKNIFLLQHYHPIRHIHCQIAASEFPTDFDSWDMLTIIGFGPLLDDILSTMFMELIILDQKSIAGTHKNHLS